MYLNTLINAGILEESEATWWRDLLENFEARFCNTDTNMWPLHDLQNLSTCSTAQLTSSTGPSTGLSSIDLQEGIPSRIRQLHTTQMAPGEKVTNMRPMYCCSDFCIATTGWVANSGKKMSMELRQSTQYPYKMTTQYLYSL